jgi:crotonobetainyl-CoA:carnitine CoA-transferase CaiB-like acyl-CoA transferase
MKVIEMAGIGPGPMAAMLLADLGATVLRVDRTVASGLGRPRPLRYNLALRSRKAIAVDLKDPKAKAFVLDLIADADVLIEGFRPGVMERLGLGPDVCLARNAGLVYGRMTGWGQEGPLSQAAAHDLNYIALTGALNAIGRRGGPPTPPLNLVGDFGGGSLYLVFGIMCALFERQRSGKGQVVDAAIVDGAASLVTSHFGLHAAGLMRERGCGPTDSGSHFYDNYQCADGKWVSIGAIEGKFYDELLERMGLTHEELGDQWDEDNWVRAKEIMAAKVREKTRDEWVALLEGTDVCFAPVLTFDEAPLHPHARARNAFVEIDGVAQPAPAPRFSRTQPGTPTPPEAAGPENVDAALSGWVSPARVAELKEQGVLQRPAS